jgi:hypothetical protein
MDRTWFAILHSKIGGGESGELHHKTLS